MALLQPVENLQVLGGSGWEAPTSVWVMSGGQWVRVASVHAVDGGSWAEAYSVTPTLASLAVTSSTTNFSTLTVAWAYGPATSHADVSLYSYPENLDGTPDTGSPTLLSTTTATTATV